MPRSSQASGPKLRLVRDEAVVSHRPRVAGLLDDNELLGAVRSGDDSAATALYHRVRPQIDATIVRLLGRQDQDAKDVAQLALIELVRSIHRFRGECSLDTWVSRVTAHVVCKQIRRRRVERGVFERTQGEPVDGVGTSTQLVARDLLRHVRAHLDDMDPGRAMAFLLHDVCGFDLREAAGMLGVSVAAAQKRLVRGRRELRDRIGTDPELADLLAEMEGDPS